MFINLCYNPDQRLYIFCAEIDEHFTREPLLLYAELTSRQIAIQPA